MTALDDYRLLGRSGLRISPLALGTMTFGASWGADRTESRRLFDAYVDRGGNFIDTAGFYADGTSEELLGSFAKGRRDQLVLSTKYSLNGQGGPNGAGNGRKSMKLSVEESLRRLDTDYIDLLFLHVWDDTTPVDEVLRGFDDLVRAGKVLYVGLSDTPAWQVARMQTMAELRGWTPLVALQIEYSLIERSVERDLIPAGQALGMGVTPWSPLASGLLSGTFGTRPAASTDPEGGRRKLLTAHGIPPRAVEIADAVRDVADALGVTSAQVALAWTLVNPAVSAPIVGARTLRQLEDNLGALDITLEREHLATLEASSQVEPGFPERMLQQDFLLAGLTGGARVRPRSTT
jgi:aryl-alcohol dehydrogenase-like predicted oxidoreductase